MLRDSDTGLLLLQSPEEKNAVRMVLGLPGWKYIEIAFQNQTQTISEMLRDPRLLSGAQTDVEAGRILGFLQGQTTQFDLVLRDLREQLEDEPPDPDAGKDTTEGDSLGLELSDAAELKGLEEHGTREPEF